MMQAESLDVLVVGAGPAGSSAARAAARGGARVLVVEKRRQVGLPVQCAEFVPQQLIHLLQVPPRCIAQQIRQMRTVLPDGRIIDKPVRGCVLDRALFDRHLAVLARQAGAELRVGWTAIECNAGEVLLRRGHQEARVQAQVIVGADGPHSTVAQWVGQSQTDFVHGAEVEVVLPEPREYTEVYFDPLYRGGYGWLFPKGETANVGVAVNVRTGGRPGAALDQLCDRLGLPPAAVVGHLGGPVPVGGPVACLRDGNVLLVGDAAGLAHPITGGGIAPAVISGQLAGQAVAQAIAGRRPGCAGSLSTRVGSDDGRPPAPGTGQPALPGRALERRPSRPECCRRRDLDRIPGLWLAETGHINYKGATMESPQHVQISMAAAKGP